MIDYTRQRTVQGQSVRADYDEGLRSYMLQIYGYMAAGLLLTGALALLTASNPTLMSLIYQTNQVGQIVGLSGLGWLVTFAPIGLALTMGLGLHRLSFTTLQGLYWTYAAVMGLSLSSVLLMYTGESVARVFFITASMFGAMSLYGYTTKRDLTALGSFLIMGLIGIIIASLVNMFLQSTGMHFVLSILGVLIFTGLTAYDTQELKRLHYEFRGTGELEAKVSLMGALRLYMDFINLFLHMLRFFGEQRRN